MGKTVDIYKNNKCIVLVYNPYEGTSFIKKELEISDSVSLLAYTVNVLKDTFIDFNEESVSFPIASLDGDYYVIDKTIFSLKHSFYFNKDLLIETNMFYYSKYGYRNFVMRIIDKYIDSDIYVETDYENCSLINHVPVEQYLKLISILPNITEINKYIGNRINYIFEGYIYGTEKRVEEYERYIQKKNNELESIIQENGNKKNEFEALIKNKADVLKITKQWLIEALENVDSYTEKDFQKKILLVILSVFPQYIYAIREVKIKGIDKHDKIPDFLLIDSDGVIDVLEIKKPDIDIIRNTTYRNNYSPSKELSSTAIQVEKYICCLKRDANNIETNPPLKIKTQVNDKINLHVINPRGMIIIGRSDDLTCQQKQDFELIRRHYMHIVDIITYDDLIHRIDSVIKSVSNE